MSEAGYFFSASISIGTLRAASSFGAAQGEVLHNDDTSMRVLRLEREPSDQRTGVFTSGIVATGADRKIALYFTWWTATLSEVTGKGALGTWQSWHGQRRESEEP